MLAWGVAPTAPHADEVIVTASGLPARPLDQAGNTARLEAARIAALDAAHFHTLGTALPGVWITRGTGQEHLTAIRSPVLTGPGSCGSFLVLENGIATRPAGFCNVNELFEVPNELAQAVEVIRGPGNALYGANALHGTLNVLLPPAGSRPGLTLRGAVGPDHYQRAMLRLDGGTDERAFNAGLVADHDGDFRDDAGYRQLKGHVGHRRRVGGGDLDLWLSGNVLDQDTAGFIVGENAYRDAARRTQNTNPGAYRDADSQRLSLRWRSADDDLAQWELAGALRRSRMDFLQHFLPGQPVEENGQDSVALVMRRYQALGAGHLTAGIDLDLARGFLRERHYLLWGYGSTGRTLRAALARHDRHPAFVIELHPGRLGNRIHGAPVVAPDELPRLPPLPLLVSVAGAPNRNRIRRTLAAMGRAEGRDFVVAA